MSKWEWWVGMRLMAKSGGSLEVGIAHATVVTLGLPALPTHETKTVCMGCKSLYAEAMLTLVLTDTHFTCCVLWRLRGLFYLSLLMLDLAVFT